MSYTRVLRIMLVLLHAVSLLVVAAARATPDPVDATVFADHTLPFTASGATPFPNPFLDAKECTSAPETCTPTDPDTRLRVTLAPGLTLPLGTRAWSQAAWRKYVFIGNYGEQAAGVLSHIADQQIGIFNTETKTYCPLNVQVGAQNASIESLEVVVPSDPLARQARVYFQGFPNGSGSAFGYFIADLDNDDPCNSNPAIGWYVRAFTNQELADASPGSPLCAPGTPPVCNFDGMRLLDDQTVVLHAWWYQKLVVARVDASGVLSIPAVYPANGVTLPPWQPGGPGGVCYNLRPVVNAAADPTFHAPSTERRFVSGFDVDCTNNPDLDPPGCAPKVPIPGSCPLTQQTCTQGQSCKTCQWPGPLTACTSNLNCPGFPNYYPCVERCWTVSAHAGLHCSVTTSRACAASSDCPPNEKCTCPPPGNPLQEFSFNGSSITPTSFLFRSAVNDVTVPPVTFDDAGNFWAGNFSQTGNVRLYLNQANNEHSYWGLANPIAPPDATLPFYNRPYLGGATGAVQLGGTMYLAGRASIQRAMFSGGQWGKDASVDAYKVTIGADVLPAESGKCLGGSQGGHWCQSNANCPGSTCAQLVPGVGTRVSLGGSPPSLWTMPSFTNPFSVPDPLHPGAEVEFQQKPRNTYLIRIPVGTNLPDNISTVRPTVAWDGNRMWLVAEHDGVLKYRVRDDGVWSLWSPIAAPGDTMTPAGGAAVVASAAPAEVTIFAHDTAGIVYRKTLTSGLACAPGSCTWGTWQGLSPVVTTNADVAATFSNVGPVVAVKSSSNNGVYATVRNSGTWSTWFRVGALMQTDAAPSLTYHPDGRAWIAARLNGSTQIMYSRINPSTFAWDNWGGLPTTGAPVAQAAPAIISDGAAVRIFVSSATFPNATSQIANDGSGWSAWRQLVNSAGATRQAVGASVNGEVNLVTYWFTNGIQESIAP